MKMILEITDYVPDKPFYALPPNVSRSVDLPGGVNPTIQNTKEPGLIEHPSEYLFIKVEVKEAEIDFGKGAFV